MSLFSRLFGGSSAPKEPEREIYKEFRIIPDPTRESGGIRLGARIEKDINGEVKTHHLIRADTFSSVDDAAEASVLKAKILIDQMGDAIFK